MANKSIYLLALAFFFIGCEDTSVVPDGTEKMQNFTDTKIVSVFEEKPEMLPIEDVFLGDNGTAKKRTYLVQNPDTTNSITFMICNLTGNDYVYPSFDDILEEFKEAHSVTDLEEIAKREDDATYYKALSGYANKYFYVKFNEGESSYDMYYALAMTEENYPDSVVAFHFLDKTKAPTAF